MKIFVEVRIHGYGDTNYENIEITEEMIKQLACDIAKENYTAPNVEATKIVLKGIEL